MNKKAYRPCPVCGKEEVEILHHQKFVLPEDHPLPKDFDVVACPDCGFTYADTIGSTADYDDYYSRFSKYEDQETSTGGGGNKKDLERLEQTADAIAAQMTNRLAKIVDIGCANGGLLGSLKARGFTDLLGIDPSLACVKNTRQIYDIPALQGWLNALPHESLGADLVIVSHVFEHVLDLKKAVLKVAEVLSANGIFYIEVPDAARYAECLVAPFQDFNIEHINHFSASSLINLLSACGFEPLLVDTKTLEASEGMPYPALFGFFRCSIELSQRTNWVYEEGFREAIDSYIRQSTAKIQDIESKICEDVSDPIFVWGTGQLTLKLLAETSLKNANIIAFIDSNPVNQGKRLLGKPICDPSFLKNSSAPILIASLLHSANIAIQIREKLNLSNPIINLH